MILSATEIAKRTGLSRGFVLEACRGEYGNYFAHPTKVDGQNKCTGKWLINEEKFLKMIEQGYFVKEG